MRSRLLAVGSVEPRLRLVRRFAQFTNEYPWQWSAADIEEWTSNLVSGPVPLAHSTLRSYQQTIAMFMDYLVDLRYGWADECEKRFGTHPVQVCHEWNTATHANGFEGRPQVRPFSRDELQSFFDFCDDQVDKARTLGRKGWLAAFRDSTLFKVSYAWGLRRREVAKLDLVDFGCNPAAEEFGNLGTLSVRWGKATKGSAPRRRNVLSVMTWAVEAVENTSPRSVVSMAPVQPYGQRRGEVASRPTTSTSASATTASSSDFPTSSILTAFAIPM